MNLIRGTRRTILGLLLLGGIAAGASLTPAAHAGAPTRIVSYCIFSGGCQSPPVLAVTACSWSGCNGEVAITGTGFRPNQPVTLDFYDARSTTSFYEMQVTAGPGGSIGSSYTPIEVYLPIPWAEFVRVVATQSQGQLLPPLASNTVTVYAYLAPTIASYGQASGVLVVGSHFAPGDTVQFIAEDGYGHPLPGVTVVASQTGTAGALLTFAGFKGLVIIHAHEERFCGIFCSHTDAIDSNYTNAQVG